MCIRSLARTLDSAAVSRSFEQLFFRTLLLLKIYLMLECLWLRLLQFIKGQRLNPIEDCDPKLRPVLSPNSCLNRIRSILDSTHVLVITQWNATVVPHSGAELRSYHFLPLIEVLRVVGSPRFLDLVARFKIRTEPREFLSPPWQNTVSAHQFHVSIVDSHQIIHVWVV